MSIFSFHWITGLLLLLGWLTPAVSQGQTVTFSGMTMGEWMDPMGGPNLVTEIDNHGMEMAMFMHGETRLDLGNGEYLEAGVMNMIYFMGSMFSEVTPGATNYFKLGNLTMLNGTTFYDSEAENVTLRLFLSFEEEMEPVSVDIPLTLITTDNSSDRIASADIVQLPSVAPIIQAPDGNHYKLNLRWLSLDPTSAIVSGTRSVFIYEGSSAQVELRGALEWMPPPTIVNQPQGSNGDFGSPLQLAVSALNAATYQWYRGPSGDTSTPVVEGTSRTLTSPRSSAGPYWVRVSNPYGSIDSQAAVVTVNPVTLAAEPMTITGASLTLVVNGAVAPGATFEWYHRDIRVPDATGRQLIFNPLTPEQAGFYRAVATVGSASVSTELLPVSLVTVPEQFEEVNIGSTALLEVFSAGPAQTFQWLDRDLRPLPENAHFQGTLTQTLRINRVAATDDGLYFCRVSDGINTVVKQLELEVFGKPLVKLFSNGEWKVGKLVDAFIGTQIDGDNFSIVSVSGLPPGVTLNRTTGLLTGRPAKAGTYSVRMRGRNSYGLGSITVQHVVVQGLSGGRLGTFHGLVERDFIINNGLGGRFTMTTTINGGLTGVLTTGATSRPFIGSLLQFNSEIPGSDIARADVQLPATGGLPARTLSFLIGTDGVLTGGLRGGEAVAAVRAVRSPWTGTIRASNYAGVHLAALPLDPELEGDDAVPQGTGYLAATINLSGSVSATARLSDGTSSTISTIVCQDQSIPFHYLLYSGTGSAQGWASSNGQVINGDLTWAKLPQPENSSTRSYKAGFEPHRLGLLGGRRSSYTGNQLVLGLPDQPNNAWYSVSLMDGVGDLAQGFRITTARNAQMQTGSPLSLIIDRDLARFSGTINVDGRSGPVSGLFIEQLNAGLGYVIIPESTAADAPLLSRPVTIQAAAD